MLAVSAGGETGGGVGLKLADGVDVAGGAEVVGGCDGLTDGEGAAPMPRYAVSSEPQYELLPANVAII